MSGPCGSRRSADTLVLVGVGARGPRRRPARGGGRAGRPPRAADLAARAGGRGARLGRRARPTLDADPGTYDQIAAVTTSADGQLTPQSPVHVFVNPDVYDGLRPTGAQVVMSHEATHVATGRSLSTMPLWILGVADHVALRDVDLPVARSASQIIAEVRKDGAPRLAAVGRRLRHPHPDLGATYESAWLANRLLAQDGGQAALVRFYRDVDGGVPVGRACRRTSGSGSPPSRSSGAASCKTWPHEGSRVRTPTAVSPWS